MCLSECKVLVLPLGALGSLLFESVLQVLTRVAPALDRALEQLLLEGVIIGLKTALLLGDFLQHLHMHWSPPLYRKGLNAHTPHYQTGLALLRPGLNQSLRTGICRLFGGGGSRFHLGLIYDKTAAGVGASEEYACVHFLQFERAGGFVAILTICVVLLQFAQAIPKRLPQILMRCRQHTHSGQLGFIYGRV